MYSQSLNHLTPFTHLYEMITALHIIFSSAGSPIVQYYLYFFSISASVLSPSSSFSLSLPHSNSAPLCHFLAIINNLWKTFQRVQLCRRSCPGKWKIIAYATAPLSPPLLNLHMLQVQSGQREISVIRPRAQSPGNYCPISETFVKLVRGEWWLY